MRRQKIFYYFILICITALHLTSCSSAKYTKTGKEVEKLLNSTAFSNHFTGILVIDPVSGDTLIAKNSKAYFTPASNVKIFTLFTALHYLPDQLPVARYKTSLDSLWFFGTGNPAQLHPRFNDSTLVKFIQAYKKIWWYPDNNTAQRYGPGWAWEDYPYYYSPERSSLPLYGNAVRISTEKDTVTVSPEIFRDSLRPWHAGKRRNEFNNRFYIDASRLDTILIPLKMSPSLVKTMLEDAGTPPIEIVEQPPPGEYRTLSGSSRDSILAEMMIESDNFLAEQIMLMASSTLGDTLSFNRIRDSVLNRELQELPQKPRWVDGSGLSRYNLFSPESIVKVLDLLHKKYKAETLFQFFPQGGVNGTLENWYGGIGEPYVFAKTGTLGNTYCVSGYLRTNEGRILVFSFMNNHFTVPTSRIKMEMQSIFELMRNRL